MASTDVLANTALVAAIVAGFGWVFNKGYDISAKRLERRSNRRAAIISFYVDVRLRAKSLSATSNAASIAAYKVKTEALIRDHANRKAPFRFYGVQIDDRRSHDLMDAHLATFQLETAELIREVILLDRHMVAQYDKLGSAEFAALEPDRQLEAVSEWLTSAELLSTKLSALNEIMMTWPELTRTTHGTDTSNRTLQRKYDGSH